MTLLYYKSLFDEICRFKLAFPKWPLYLHKQEVITLGERAREQ